MKTSFVRSCRSISALLLIVYANCGDGGNTEPAAATTLDANTSTTISAVAGTAVSPAPSVIVRDQNGNPFPGAEVTFSVVSGGGTIVGASTVTDANGVAAVGEWKLGTTAGENALSATSGTLSVTFNATGTAGPTALLVVSQGDNQLGASGAAVAIPPAVIVKDANGNVKSGVTVTFTVGSGGGTVTGAAATSNAQGIATVGSWTLGSGGLNTLVASATGAPSITFRATASNPKCTQRTPHTLGSTTNGALEADDCVFVDGTFIDFYSTTLPQAGAYLFKQIAAFNTYLDIALADGTVIAENNDEKEDSTTNSAIKVLVPAGNYIIGAGSFSQGVTGAYTMTSQVVSTDITGCETVFVITGLSTSQNIAANDCLWSEPPAPPIYADAFWILLRAGQSVTINMTSPVIDAYITLLRNGGAVVTQNDNKDGTTKDAQITFTATATDYYAIIARTGAASQTGAYTLTVQQSAAGLRSNSLRLDAGSENVHLGGRSEGFSLHLHRRAER